MKTFARRGPHRGFTLLELVVALSIFALLGVGAYRVLNGALIASGREAVRQDDFRRLNRAVRALEADLGQAVARGVRGNYGDVELPFKGAGDSLTLTRAGWPNPLGAKRGTLQRVNYYSGGDPDAQTTAAASDSDGSRVFLIRQHWRVLDRAPDSAPSNAVLLPIDTLRFRYLDNSHQWLEQWPPVGQGDAAQALPAAVEVTIGTPPFGEIRRLLAMRGIESADTHAKP
ncbi:MAG: type II secretion system minor pseudopilin GspJ [Porticoccaceae bacterium]